MVVPPFKSSGFQGAPKTLAMVLLCTHFLSLKIAILIPKVTFASLQLQADTSKPQSFFVVLNIEKLSEVDL